MRIRCVASSDHSEWLRMRNALWPASADEHVRELAQFFAELNADLATFVIDRGNARLGGFLEVRVRDYAEGCSGARVGYIEGWYVDPDLRRQGLGGRLLKAAENWALELGLAEMASDCDIGNTESLSAHLALGYQEVERIICFRKALSSDPVS
jgi:aminoglycoside 6'-N-acetyltransferase I